MGDRSVSFVICSCNRRPELAGVLRRLRDLPLENLGREVLVVDNASSDGTAKMVRSDFPHVKLFARPTNGGPVARNVAARLASGDFLVFLDDDSWPEPGSIEAMVRHFDAEPSLGAATFTVTLPDGTQECSAFPGVFIGCGTGFRRAALRDAGLLPDDFFMQAEEYDLSLRLLRAGWRVAAFDDLHVTHLKTPRSRLPGRTLRLDVRNNAVLCARYFAGQEGVPVGLDWLRRYWWIATAQRRRVSFLAGLGAAAVRVVTETHQHALPPSQARRFFWTDAIEAGFAALAEAGHRRVLLIDLGKNVRTYVLAAHKAGLSIAAIADARLHAPGRTYKGVPVVADADALALSFDVAVISNTSRVHAALRLKQWRRVCPRPVVDVLAPSAEPAVANAAVNGPAAVSPAAAGPAGAAESEFRRTAARNDARAA